MSYSADSWPIGAALLQFPNTTKDGRSVQDAPARHWARVFREVAAAGFDHVDLTDTWLRPGDLSPERLTELARTLKEAELGLTAVTTARRSVIDPDPHTAAANLEYLLRTVEAAAELGVGTVCAGLHRPLTSAQREAVWFWHEQGGRDPDGDERIRALAVERFRAVGERAAGLGVQISLEMYEDTYLGSPESAVRMVRDIGLPNVGLNPDVANLVRLHRPVPHWEELLTPVLPYANYWHIKNYYRDHDPATGAYFTVPAPAESGVINYRQAVELALDAGFEGPICVEHYGGDGLSVSARNRDYLRKILSVKLAERS
ncbi:sugar phosphate isomerase/epimerase family protein [Streptomyces himalayensis]|uniref:Sugar phosphate isomerase/epimerase n=1 Tax=Streptomyces himalayensis subsp. himalayensis TaxID=2756131 RepID=A0A7W0DIM3_9ACTN|nr:sugar phosphate isomerase/epimerase family protein [Streptomyces himalayensis]MBA2945794.1 sugar phosphate isomerase/epimerase [Streptomyces himalayensis subsp. himalayensis]